VYTIAYKAGGFSPPLYKGGWGGSLVAHDIVDNLCVQVF
jgi:hypothetical protein